MCTALGSTWRSVWSDSIHSCISLAVRICFEKGIIKQSGHCANIKNHIIQMKMAIASLRDVVIWKSWGMLGANMNFKAVTWQMTISMGWKLRLDKQCRIVSKALYSKVEFMLYTGNTIHYRSEGSVLEKEEVRRVSQLPADLLRVHIEMLTLWCSSASPPVFSM